MSWNGSNTERVKIEGRGQQGKSSPDSLNLKPQPSSIIRHGLVAGLVVVALGLSAHWYFGRARTPSAPHAPDVVRPAHIKAVTPAPAPKQRAAEEDKEKTAKARPERVQYADEESREAAERRNRHELMWARKLKTDKRLQAYLKNYKPPQQTFKTGTEQVLDWIFNAKVGDNPPVPLPPMSQFELDHIDEVLDSVNEIKDEDDEALAERKRVVDEVKGELKDYLAKGGTVQEFFDHYHAELQRAWETKAEARHSVEQVMEEGDNNLSVKYLEKVNKLLDVQGIPEIELTDEEKEALNEGK